MNPPPLPWCYRCVAIAATVGALTGPVGPVRTAAAAVRPVPPVGAAERVAVAGPQVADNDAGNDADNDAGNDADNDAGNVGLPATSELVYQPGSALGAPFPAPLASSGNNNRGGRGETVNVLIPRWEGGLTITVSNTPVQLSPAMLAADSRTVEFTGQLPELTISDNRYVSTPGWSVTGQVSDFSGDGRDISGSDLGWTPAVVTQNPTRDVVAGPAVSPGTRPGLTDVSVLASAPATKGTGTAVVGATLDLRVPANTRIGSLAATLSITVVA